ncbi:hypothetical protein EV715DRAFT_297917 [Schizophyllum commune]
MDQLVRIRATYEEKIITTNSSLFPFRCSLRDIVVYYGLRGTLQPGEILARGGATISIPTFFSVPDDLLRPLKDATHQLQSAFDTLHSLLPQSKRPYQVDPHQGFIGLLDQAPSLEELHLAWVGITNRMRYARKVFEERYDQAARVGPVIHDDPMQEGRMEGKSTAIEDPLRAVKREEDAEGRATNSSLGLATLLGFQGAEGHGRRGDEPPTGSHGSHQCEPPPPRRRKPPDRPRVDRARNPHSFHRRLAGTVRTEHPRSHEARARQLVILLAAEAQAGAIDGADGEMRHAMHCGPGREARSAGVTINATLAYTGSSVPEKPPDRADLEAQVAANTSSGLGMSERVEQRPAFRKLSDGDKVTKLNAREGTDHSYSHQGIRAPLAARCLRVSNVSRINPGHVPSEFRRPTPATPSPSTYASWSDKCNGRRKRRAKLAASLRREAGEMVFYFAFDLGGLSDDTEAGKLFGTVRTGWILSQRSERELPADKESSANSRMSAKPACEQPASTRDQLAKAFLRDSDLGGHPVQREYGRLALWKASHTELALQRQSPGGGSVESISPRQEGDWRPSAAYSRLETISANARRTHRTIPTLRGDLGSLPVRHPPQRTRGSRLSKDNKNGI